MEKSLLVQDGKLGKNKRAPSRKPLYLLVLYFDNLTLIVRSASLANSMRHNQSTTLGALNKVCCTHLPICSSAVSAGLG